MHSPAYDLAVFVLFAFATGTNLGASRFSAEHKPIWRWVGLACVGNAVALTVRDGGTAQLTASLIMPCACACAVAGSHGIRAWVSLLVTFLPAAIVIGTRTIVPQFYQSAVIMAWVSLAAFAWASILAPVRRPHGLTRWVAVALAASMLADVPGVYLWTSRGSWSAECALSVLSLAIVGTLPLLWTCGIFEQPPSESCSLASGSCSAT